MWETDPFETGNGILLPCRPAGDRRRAPAGEPPPAAAAAAGGGEQAGVHQGVNFFLLFVFLALFCFLLFLGLLFWAWVASGGPGVVFSGL